MLIRPLRNCIYTKEDLSEVVDPTVFTGIMCRPTNLNAKSKPYADSYASDYARWPATLLAICRWSEAYVRFFHSERFAFHY